MSKLSLLMVRMELTVVVMIDGDGDDEPLRTMFPRWWS